MSPSSSVNSNPYYVHRAISTGFRTFLVVLVMGVSLSFTERPRFQTTVKLLLESDNNQQTIVDSSNPLSDLLHPRVRTIGDQIEIMKGDKVFSDACKDADVPPDSVTMDVHQIPGTSVVEIDVESTTATYAERFAKTVPNTYTGYVTGNHRTELLHTYEFATTRLKEQNESLIKAQDSLEAFVVENGRMAPTEYSVRLSELQRDVNIRRSTVEKLAKCVEDLRLRPMMTHDPVLVISQAKSAQQISPNRTRYAFNSAILGIILGLFAAGLQFLFRKP